MDLEALITGLLGAGGGASLAALAARALMREEISRVVEASLAKERASIDALLAREHTAMRERFATREDVLRLEAKIDVLIARLGGV